MALRDTWHRALVYFGLAEEDDAYRDDGPEPQAQPEAELEDRYRDRPNVRRLNTRRRRDEIDDIFSDEGATTSRSSTRVTNVLRPVDGGGGNGRGGAQVHLLSVRAQLGMRARGYSAYCATKGALVMLIRQHASELAPHGIRVNGVAPTVVATEMGRHWLDNDTTRRYLLERIPMGRVADPKDIVGPVLFLCAPAASFVTGQVLYVDGGITAGQ